MNPNWPFPTEVLRSKKRKKTVSIQVVDGRVRVLCPYGTSNAYIQQLIQARRAWIERALSRQTQARPADARILDRHFWLRGKPLRLQCVDVADSAWTVRMQGDVLYVHAPKQRLSDESLRQALIAWYRQVAEADFSARLERWSKRIGVQYSRFRIKDQKTRWGSCSSKANINLNWRLIQAPDFAIDYVVVHELCHLREMNHSDRFWALVEAALPTYREGREWLRKHGKELYF